MQRPSRWLAPLVLSLLLLPAISRSSRAATSDADSAYRSYRIPDHRWRQTSASLGASASHRDNSFQSSVRSRGGSFRGNLAARAAWGFDSDPSALAWNLAADVRADRQHDETHVLDSFQDATGENSGKNLDQLFSASGSWRRYPWRTPVGFSLSASNLFALSQRFNSGEGTRVLSGQTERTLGSSGIGTWTYQGALSAGVGLGRVRDATPVYQAQVLEERLRRTGALSRTLSPAARERLAALLATRGVVTYAHQRPDKYFWESLEKVLRDDGALERGSLDAYSAHRVLEPVVSAGSVFRRVGYFVGPAVVVSTARTHQSREETASYVVLVGGVPTFISENRSDLERTDRQDNVLTALVAEAHRPMGLRWQTDASHTTQIGESGSFVAASTVLSASYLVSDRWVGSVSARHSAQAAGRGSARRIDSWDVSLGADLSYFLEDAWALSLRASEGQRHRTTDFNRSGDFSLGITRILSGYFELPGIAAMRLTPPTP